MPRVYNYDLGDIVIVNDKPKKDVPGYVGRIGTVFEYLNGATYDYKVYFSEDEIISFKEGELDLAPKVDDYVKVIHSDDKGFVATVDYDNKQVEVNFGAVFGVYNFNEVQVLKEDKGEIQVEKSYTNVELFNKVLAEKGDIYTRKNQDYGNSFSEQFAEYGLLSAVIRLDDKLRRLKQLLHNEAQVKDESIRDTLVDLSNYADMTVMELDRRKNEQ